MAEDLFFCLLDLFVDPFSLSGGSPCFLFFRVAEVSGRIRKMATVCVNRVWRNDEGT